MDNLTNDSKFLLASLYKIYITRRNDGIPKNEAVFFKDVEHIHQEIMPEWSFDDVEFTCFELRKHGLITGILASDTIITICISTEAIALLEKNFSDKVDNVLEFMTKIKNAIPFL